MITDALLQLSNGQTLTGTGNVVSTNVIDLSQARDLGIGEDLYVFFGVGTAFAGGTSVQAQLIVADDAAMTTNVATMGASDVLTTAKLVAGKTFALEINPHVGSIGRRYMAIQYVLAGTFTAGTMSANIVNTIQDGAKFYPSGFTATV